MNLDKKRQREIDIVTLMIRLYCRHHDDICEEELLQYARERIEKCPKMKEKTFCSQCAIHCYRKDMQKQIKKVMRYSGPRMIFYHPVMAIRHALKI